MPVRDILLFIGKGGGAMKRVVYVIVGVIGDRGAGLVRRPPEPEP